MRGEAHRLLALQEAAVEMCGYCRGVKGINPVPETVFGELHHLFIRGNGSNRCTSAPIWSMVQAEKEKLEADGH